MHQFFSTYQLKNQKDHCSTQCLLGRSLGEARLAISLMHAKAPPARVTRPTRCFVRVAPPGAQPGGDVLVQSAPDGKSLGVPMSYDAVDGRQRLNLDLRRAASSRRRCSSRPRCSSVRR